MVWYLHKKQQEKNKIPNGHANIPTISCSTENHTNALSLALYMLAFLSPSPFLALAQPPGPQSVPPSPTA